MRKILWLFFYVYNVQVQLAKLIINWMLFSGKSHNPTLTYKIVVNCSKFSPQLQWEAGVICTDKFKSKPKSNTKRGNERSGLVDLCTCSTARYNCFSWLLGWAPCLMVLDFLVGQISPRVLAHIDTTVMCQKTNRSLQHALFTSNSFSELHISNKIKNKKKR